MLNGLKCCKSIKTKVKVSFRIEKNIFSYLTGIVMIKLTAKIKMTKK